MYIHLLDLGKLSLQLSELLRIDFFFKKKPKTKTGTGT